MKLVEANHVCVYFLSFCQDIPAPESMAYVVPVRLYGDGADAFSAILNSTYFVCKNHKVAIPVKSDVCWPEAINRLSFCHYFQCYRPSHHPSTTGSCPEPSCIGAVEDWSAHQLPRLCIRKVGDGQEASVEWLRVKQGGQLEFGYPRTQQQASNPGKRSWRSFCGL